MKNKNKSPFLIEAIVLAVAALISLPLRLLQYGDKIEPYLGFYTGFGFTFVLFYIVLGAAVAMFIASSFIKRKNVYLNTQPVKMIGNGIVSLICAASVVFGAYTSFTSKTHANTAAYVVTPKVPAAAYKVELAFAFIAAVYFAVLAISYFAGRSTGIFGILSLGPVIWNVVRLVLHFTTTISYIRVSDLMLDMLALAMYSIFFMSFAQVNSEINGEGLEWKISAFGLSGALLGLICFIPRFVLLITGREEYIYVLSSADISDLGMAAFMISTVLTRINSGKKAQVIPETVE